MQSSVPIIYTQELKNNHGKHDYEVFTFLRQATLLYQENSLRARHISSWEMDFSSIKVKLP